MAGAVRAHPHSFTTLSPIHVLLHCLEHQTTERLRWVVTSQKLAQQAVHFARCNLRDGSHLVHLGHNTRVRAGFHVTATESSNTRQGLPSDAYTTTTYELISILCAAIRFKPLLQTLQGAEVPFLYRS